MIINKIENVCVNPYAVSIDFWQYQDEISLYMRII